MVCRSLPGRGGCGAWPRSRGVTPGKRGLLCPCFTLPSYSEPAFPPTPAPFAFLEMGLHQSPPHALKIQ